MPISAARKLEEPISGSRRATDVSESIGAHVVYGTRKAKRAYGFHPFPGRKDSNIVQTYILHHTRKSDLVLDVFGGSGTTAREALIARRRALIVDINPVMELITRASVLPVDLQALRAAFQRVRDGARNEVLAIDRMAEDELAVRLAEYDLTFLEAEIPRIIRRGANRGISRLKDLHDPRQVLGLLILREHVNSESDLSVRALLRTTFSHALKYATKMYIAGPNRSFWAGNTTVFRNLAYQVPAQWSDYRNVWEIFDHVFKNVLAGKQETQNLIGDYSREGDTFTFIRGSATRLLELLADRGLQTGDFADYCITDPPYAEVVQYPLLFTLWYAWLDMEPPELGDDLTVVAYPRDAKAPALQQQFISRFDLALQGIASALRPGAWLTLFYQHSNLAYWTPIVESAQRHSLRYLNLVPQPQQIKSFAQHRNPFETLAGHLIVNFRKMPETSYRELYRRRGGQVVFPNLLKFAQLELQRIIVEYLGADTETIAFHLISVLLDPSLMSERLDEALRVVDILRANELQALGAEFANGTENLWMLKPECDADRLIDPYDRFRYHLFAFLRGRRIVSPRELQGEAMRLLGTGEYGGLEVTSLPTILGEFAAPTSDGWKYSPERRAAAIRPRLALARSSADKLRPIFFEADRRLLRVQPEGVDQIRALYAPGGDESERYSVLRSVVVAALAELRNRFTDSVSSVWAIDELAAGELDLSKLELIDIPLGIVAARSDVDVLELSGALSKEVFGPLFLDTGLMLVPAIRPPGQEDWTTHSASGAFVLLDAPTQHEG
jgi:hypothetical protein